MLTVSTPAEAHRMSTLGLEREPYFENEPAAASPIALGHSRRSSEDSATTGDHEDRVRSGEHLARERSLSRNSGDGLSHSSNYYDPYSDMPQSNEHEDTEMQHSRSSLVKDPTGSNGSRLPPQDTEYLPFSKGDSEDIFGSRQEDARQDTSPLARFFQKGKYPLAQRIEDKKRGIGRQRYPFAVWVLTAAMIGVMIYELVYNDKEQGNPFSFKPVVNPMLGPSSSGLIHLGARFPACMKDVSAIPVDTQLACPNNTANPVTRVCDLEEVCGFGGFHSQTPNQWFRFITPIFLHAGIVHILLNMVAQLTVSAQIEREMGSGGFLLTYFAAGIFGNVLGGNFALVGLPSTGASGAIFGTVAVTWVDLLAHWRYHYRPGRKLAWMIVELLLGVAMGYIPYVDNFAHLGGFLMGLLVGMFFYPVISVTKQHKGVVWGFRLVALPLIIVLFVVLIRNFYTTDPNAACPGCRYLSCLPLKLNQYCKGTGLTTSTTTS